MAVSEALYRNEKLIKVLKPSRWAYFWWYFLGGITTFYVVGLFILILTELIRRANAFYLTDKRIIHEYDFLARKISSVPYDKIQDLHMSQGLIERIVGIGTIHIDSAGTSFIELTFKGVARPISVKRMIEEKMLK